MYEKGSFEQQYKKKECFWGLKPNRYIVDILKYKKTGTVLDLGTGEGKNALFLAKNGFDVTGVDISESGINKFKSLADEFGVKVKGIVEDITKFKFEGKYDVIISTATLHFLKEKEIKELITKMKEHTNKSGLNVITAFTEDNPSKNFTYLFKRNELRGFYKEWHILQYAEFLTPLEEHGGKPHRHAIATIIAQKQLPKPIYVNRPKGLNS